MDAPLKTQFELDDGITLRAWRESDIDAAQAVVLQNREHLREFMHWMTPDYNAEDGRKHMIDGIAARSEHKSLGLGVFRGDQVIGSIGIVAFDWISRACEIGYWLDKDEEGKGIMTKATQRLIEYAFDELGLNRIEIRCASDNVRSAAVPVRLGFRKEGVLRQAAFRNGRMHDFDVYGLLAEDPRLW